jgi:hypothetical protein
VSTYAVCSLLGPADELTEESLLGFPFGHRARSPALLLSATAGRASGGTELLVYSVLVPGARGLLLTLSRGIGAGVIAGEGRVYDAVRDRVCRHTGAFFLGWVCIRDGQRTGSVAAVHVRVPSLCIALRRRMYCTCYTVAARSDRWASIVHACIACMHGASNWRN